MKAERAGRVSGPRIVVGGVTVSGDGRGGRRGGSRPPSGLLRALAILALGCGALALGSGLLSSCSAGLEAELAAGGGASVRLAADIPLPVAQKLRRLASLPEGAPLFELEAFRASLQERKGLSILSLSSPSPESLRASLSVRSLPELLAAPDLANPGILVLARRGGESELSLRFARGQGRALAELLPGLDPYLLESLSPPALEEEPLSRAEYREMLASIFGERSMPAMEGAALTLRIRAPGEVTASRGGRLEGRTLAIAIPILDLLVLERPLEYSLTWRD